MTLERLRAMLTKEIIQVVRDRKMRFVIFAIPLFQVIVFGYAVSTDVRRVPTAIYDLDRSRESREVAESFVKSGYFTVKRYVTTAKEMEDVLDRGDVKVILGFGTGFARHLDRGDPALLQIFVDGTDASTAGIILKYAGEITQRWNERLNVQKKERYGPKPVETTGIRLVTRTWFNENLESRNFYLPAVIAMLLLVITMLLSSLAIVREKELGTIEQIMVTPISRGEFILGKTIPFALIGFFDMLVVTGVATWWFAIPIRGSILLLLAATGIFLMSTLGIGLLISTISKTQQQAMMTAFFVVFPAMLLSGFAFPIENMPQPVQWLTWLNPLRYYMIILRTIFLKGAGISVLWPQFAPLILLGLGILSAAVHRFRKTL